MAFMRKQAVVEATDINTITPQEAETRITAGVKKYATNEANYAKADGNTPYLGHLVGIAGRGDAGPAHRRRAGGSDRARLMPRRGSYSLAE